MRIGTLNLENTEHGRMKITPAASQRQPDSSGGADGRGFWPPKSAFQADDLGSALIRMLLSGHFVRQFTRKRDGAATRIWLN
jgi:hypothetical protein